MSPLTEKGAKILSAMKKEYGEKGESVFYASKNVGTISGVDEISRMTQITEGPGLDAVLNWGGNVNGETVLPGGQGDTPKMPQGASIATGVGSTDGMLAKAKTGAIELGKHVAAHAVSSLLEE
jgi:hypothetical protein